MEMEQQFVVEDLFDFPNDDLLVDDEFVDSSPQPPDSSSTVVTPVDSTCNSALDHPHLPPVHPHFSGDGLCVPSDDLAELEWLSNFVEESFSSEDLQKLQLLSGLEAKPPSSSRSSLSSESHALRPKFTRAPPIPLRALPPDVPVPGRPRSKRSRAAPCDWSSRLQVLSKPPPRKRAETAEGEALLDGGSGSGSSQRCLHCGSVKTPQWRTGPMGPKTLCNACGVRYKSGRLVPEYRPAASPTFISSRHSNSHRKVMELRRQKEQLQTVASPPPFVRQKNRISDGCGGGGDFFIRRKMLV